MSDIDTMKNITSDKMTLQDIKDKLPFLDLYDPLIYHIYASVNKLSDTESEQVRATISVLKRKQYDIKQHYLDTCINDASF